MFLRTIQATAIRNIFEVIKEIINDVNIYFDSTGIRIVTLDTARVSLIHVFLDAKNFEEYSCPQEVIAGVNLSNTFKLLKCIGVNDTLTMSIKDSEYIEISIDNEMKKSHSKFQLKLLDINEDILDVPEIPMDILTTIPSIDFQRVCRDMGNLSNTIELKRDGELFVMSCLGDFANQTTTIQCSESAPTIGNVFSLKYINMFTKASGMCSSVQIFQSSQNADMPIIFRYSIANLGTLKFYLAPKIDT